MVASSFWYFQLLSTMFPSLKFISIPLQVPLSFHFGGLPLPFKSMMNPKVAIYGLDLLKSSDIAHYTPTNSSMISHQGPALRCVKLCVSCSKIPPISLSLHPLFPPKHHFHRIHALLRYDTDDKVVFRLSSYRYPRPYAPVVLHSRRF